ncbi:MAG: hypothetical protein ACRC6T_09530 [Sarcina sp.]
MKKSFITISLVATLVVSGTAIYSATNTTKNTQNLVLSKAQNLVAPNFQTSNKTTTITSPTDISPKQNILNKRNITDSNTSVITSKLSSQLKEKEVTKPKTINTSPMPKQQKININATIKTTTLNTRNKSEIPEKHMQSTHKKISIATPNINKTITSKTNSQLSNSQIYARLKQIVMKTSSKGTGFVTNLNDYKLINGKKYFNVYEYCVGNKSNDWVSNGNHSNFIGARYLNVDGKGLNTQFVQNFKDYSTSEKEASIKKLATQFASYFPVNSSKISVDMKKTLNFEGYNCYLVHMGNKSFYMTPSGFIYINKNQAFY